MKVALAALLLLTVASPAAAARRPNPRGKCACDQNGGIPPINKPVCGADLVTYGNECVAKCNNVLIAYDGVCKHCQIKTNDCNCGNAGYSPKCSFGLTWSNTCDALCGGYSCPMTNGVCQYRASDLGTYMKTPPGRNKPGDAQKAARISSLPGKSGAHYSYTEALHKVLIFMESMRSGKLDRQRLAWRSDSCFNCKGPSGEDLSKGYYEAGGSFLKLGLVESFLVTMLSDAVLTFPDGFKKSGDLQNALDAIGWGVDYLLAAHSASDRFVAVLGNDTLDFNYYGSLERYDQYVKSRPSCYINKNSRGSEIAGEAAAALAAASMAFKAHGVKRNTASMLSHAKQLYALGSQYPGSYNSANPKSCLGTHKRLYSSQNGYKDELAWGAAWIYSATKDSHYLSEARKWYGQLQQPPYAFDAGNKIPALNVIMQQLDPSNGGRYFTNAQGFFRPYMDGTIPHTPRGLAYPYHFGALRPTTQMAYLALKQSKILRSRNQQASYAAQLFNYAAFQINYVLGDGGRSWLVGFGHAYPQYIWHKPSYNAYIDEPLHGKRVYANIRSQKTDNTVKKQYYADAAQYDIIGSLKPQRFIAYGALYGAPLQDDNMVVGRKDYSYTEATTDGVSGVAGAFAGLAEYYSNKQGHQSDCGLDLGWTHRGAKMGPRSINNTAACAHKG